jgi:hypothetical protein
MGHTTKTYGESAVMPNKKIFTGQPKQHFLVLSIVVYIVVFGAIGIHFEFFSHAATTIQEVASGISGKCMDDYHDATANYSKVDIYTCNGTAAQNWVIVQTKGGELIKHGSQCLDTYHSGTANGTHVQIYSCDGRPNQVWTYSTTKHTIINVLSGRCLDDTEASTTDGTQMQIYGCNGKPQQNWTFQQYQPPQPNPNPNPNPNPSPNPNPNPSPNPNPNPSPNPSPSPSGSGVNPTSSGSATQNAQSVGSTTASVNTLNSSANSNQSNGATPSVSKLASSSVTADSVVLTWSAGNATNYVIQYGTSQHATGNTMTYFASTNTVSVTLKNLPAGKKIYVDITPYNNGVAGPMKQVSFTTQASSSPVVPIVSAVVVVIVTAGASTFFFMRKPVKRSRAYMQPSDILEGMAAPFHEETPNQYYQRVHGWQDAAAPVKHQQPAKRDDDIPDMYEEGNKRLSNEEHQHKI